MESLGDKISGGHWALWNTGNALIIGGKRLEKRFIL